MPEPSDLEKFMAEVKERRATASCRSAGVFYLQRQKPGTAAFSPEEWASVLDSIEAICKSQADVATLVEIANQLNVRLNEHTQPKAAGCRWCEFGDRINRIARAAMEKSGG